MVTLNDERPTCSPPHAHIFLDGRFSCECGLIDYADLMFVMLGEPLDTRDETP